MAYMPVQGCMESRITPGKWQTRMIVHILKKEEVCCKYREVMLYIVPGEVYSRKAALTYAEM